MNSTFYFLRHAETKVDKNTPISKWILSEKGKEQARQLAEGGSFDDVDIVCSSAEQKAYQTAKLIAEKLGKAVTRLAEINELDRDAREFLGPDDYEEKVEYCLKHPSESVNSWETVEHALERFEKKIDELDRQYENKKILVVGHGFTINLYFAKLLGVLDGVYERLNKNNFGDWGVVKNQKVVKDIANA